MQTERNIIGLERSNTETWKRADIARFRSSARYSVDSIGFKYIFRRKRGVGRVLVSGRLGVITYVHEGKLAGNAISWLALHCCGD